MTPVFETRRRRGWAIGVVAAAIIVGYAVVDFRASDAVDKRSSRVEALLRARLPGTDPLLLAAGGDPAELLGEELRYATVIHGAQGDLTVRAEVSSVWQSRCIIATRSLTAKVEVETREGRCDHRLPLVTRSS